MEVWRKILVGLLIVSALACIVIGIVSLAYIDKKMSHSILGDYVGGFAGAMWTLAGSILVFLAFVMQQAQINDTRQQFLVQSFESSFYNLLNFHNLNIQQMDVEDEKGKDCFRVIYDRLEGIYNGSDHIENSQKRLDLSADQLLKQFPLDLPLYLGSIEGIIDHIKEEEAGIDKNRYYMIVFKQLTHHEVALIYYFKKKYPSYKSLIESPKIKPLVEQVLKVEKYSLS